MYSQVALLRSMKIFTSFSSGSMGTNINAGMTTATVRLPIIGDTTDEDDETISIEFIRTDGSVFTNSGGGVFSVELTIVDDDGKPAAPAAPVLVPKGTGLDVRLAAADGYRRHGHHGLRCAPRCQADLGRPRYLGRS